VEEIRAEGTERADELAAIGEVLRGNKDAFRLIVDRYKGLIVRLSLSFLGNREEAEEAAQEIFLRAFRSLHRFSLDKKLLPWLYSIAVNHLRSAYGRMKRRDERTTSVEVELAAGGESDPQRLVMEDFERSALRQAVDSLPPTLREVIVLYYYEEMRVEAISSVLNIGVENVKSRLFRGRQKLRETLQKSATLGRLP
jgi:RNA polymerase sigma factor (sigma-70 family)